MMALVATGTRVPFEVTVRLRNVWVISVGVPETFVAMPTVMVRVPNPLLLIKVEKVTM